jgi:hypothetical protein
MIIDAFTFAGELDMLECRLTELESVADVFMVVEAGQTFQGAPKPLYYGLHADRFARWADRILYVTCDTLEGADPWEREANQREGMAAGLDLLNASPTDVMVVSDVDEIWRHSIHVARLPRPYAVLAQTMYVHHFGWRHPDPWDGPVVVRVADLPPESIGTFQAVRSARLHPRPLRVAAAGWHLSYFGGREAVAAKLAAFSHTEFSHVDMTSNEAQGLHVDGTPLIASTTPTDVPKFASTMSGWWR